MSNTLRITYGYDDFPSDMLPELARTLGKLHKTLDGYELPMGLDQDWIDRFSIESDSEKYDKLLKELAKHKTDPNYQEIEKDLMYKKRLVLKGLEFAKHYHGITYTASHGDYQGCQLICENEHIKAIIDFSGARVLPATWEIMRSYIQSSQYSKETAHIDINGLCEYVQAYMQYFSLSKTDLKSMPYVYLFQLMRSKYGYLQYLNTDSEDRESLLKFAFWRTAICREVEEKAEMISNELVRL